MNKKVLSVFILLPLALACSACSGAGANSNAQSPSSSLCDSSSKSQSKAQAATSPEITSQSTKATTTAITTTVTEIAEPSESLKSFSGIDISKWQGCVDFEKVKADGIETVYIKAGDSFNEDMYFRTNAENAENAGLLVGFYFYVTANDSQQARLQAEYFADLLDSVDYQCRPAVDFEAFGNLSYDSINEIALTFAQTVEAKTGVAPIFYTDADNIDIWNEELTKYPLWVADYDANPPSSLGNWSEYAAFQYSCTDTVEGITENVVDLDIYTEAVLP